jgi:hypothetical protein
MRNLVWIAVRWHPNMTTADVLENVERRMRTDEDQVRVQILRSVSPYLALRKMESRGEIVRLRGPDGSRWIIREQLQDRLTA